MNADQAWQSALGQLQMEMPKASFDTWVRDTTLVAYEDGLFTIGVRNAYAREWLESRLSSTVTRLLTGIMNRDADVRFVVADRDSPESRDDAPEDAENIVEIRIEEYDSAYEQTVRPDRAVYLPGYFRRHLRALGPGLAWFYVGFRQAAYTDGGRRGQKWGRFSGKQVAALCGISERTFWNRVKRVKTWDALDGLVTAVETEPEWQRGEKPRRMPRRYTVAMSIPMTAADARSLMRWLADHIEKHGCPEGVLAAACETPLDKLLPSDAQAGEGDCPMQIRAILRDLFGSELPKEELDAFAERLRLHIMSQNDQIVISLFFLEYILPWLREGPAWMYVLLRDRCFVSEDEKRDTVTVRGGYREIADWLDLSRPMTVWEWLREPIVRIYLRDWRDGEGKTDKMDAPRSFQVLLSDVPTEIIEAAIKGNQAENSSAIFSIGVTRISVSGHANFSIGVTRFSESGHANFSISVTRISEFSHAIFRVFKLLNSLNQPLNSKEPPPPLPPSSKNGLVAVVPSSWILKHLFTLNRISGKKRRELESASAKAFVSWLLYAVSRDGGGIQNPVSFALSQLQQDPQAGAGGAFDQFAALSPAELVRLIRWSFGNATTKKYLTGEEYLNRQDEFRNNLWEQTMGEKNVRIGLLLKILLGEEPDFKITVTRENTMIEREYPAQDPA